MTVTEGIKAGTEIFGATAAALGSFDALHQGHMTIIGSAVDYAKKNGCLSLVQLFSYPESMDVKVINTIEKRIEILEKAGVDIVVIESFDDSFKNMSAEEFVAERVRRDYRAEAVFAGFNYRFGKGASGDTAYLASECGKYGIKTFITECVELDGCISSSRIREALRRGDTDFAAEMMGRPYTMRATVVHGRQLGRTMGFPTANTDLPSGTVVPAAGVYATRTVIDGRSYPAITNVGAKPTVGETKANAETHIIGFEGDLYGKRIELEFYKRLREICRFEDTDKLRGQLEKDVAAALEVFGERNKNAECRMQNDE